MSTLKNVLGSYEDKSVIKRIATGDRNDFKEIIIKLGKPRKPISPLIFYKKEGEVK